MTGMISGSSVANVVTTGTFTIPLMKRVGYSPVKAGAIECAAGVNGQLMPPVMGAAAFLMAEYVGITYAEVCKHAFLPAILTYGALFYIVDLEAVKAGMSGLPRTKRRTAAGKPPIKAADHALRARHPELRSSTTALGWTKTAFGEAASWIAGGRGGRRPMSRWCAIRARHPDLPLDDPNKALRRGAGLLRDRAHRPALPPAGRRADLVPDGRGDVARPLGLLGRRRDGGVVLTQRPLTAFFRGERGFARAVGAQGWRDFVDGLASGARNMTAVGIATATAGILVGTVTLTGIGLVMTEIVEFLSGGSIVIMLVLVGVICLILGTGLPTTASYVVVATLMAPVVVELAARERSRGAADRGAHVRVLFRPDGRRLAAGRARRLRRRARSPAPIR